MKGTFSFSVDLSRKLLLNLSDLWSKIDISQWMPFWKVWMLKSKKLRKQRFEGSSVLK